MLRQSALAAEKWNAFPFQNFHFEHKSESRARGERKRRGFRSLPRCQKKPKKQVEACLWHWWLTAEVSKMVISGSKQERCCLAPVQGSPQELLYYLTHPTQVSTLPMTMISTCCWRKGLGKKMTSLRKGHRLPEPTGWWIFRRAFSFGGSPPPRLQLEGW